MIRLAIGLTIVCVGLVLALFIAVPIRAEDRPPECYGVDRVVSEVTAAGGSFIDLVDVRSDHFDQLLIVVAGGRLLIGGVKGGCMASPPVALDSVAPVTPA